MRDLSFERERMVRGQPLTIKARSISGRAHLIGLAKNHFAAVTGYPITDNIFSPYRVPNIW